jgi:hypothetical protein
MSNLILTDRTHILKLWDNQYNNNKRTTKPKRTIWGKGGTIRKVKPEPPANMASAYQIIIAAKTLFCGLGSTLFITSTILMYIHLFFKLK